MSVITAQPIDSAAAAVTFENPFYQQEVLIAEQLQEKRKR